MVKIAGKVFKTGSGYAITLRKALVDAEIIKQGDYLEMELVAKRNEKYEDAVYQIPSDVRGVCMGVLKQDVNGNLQNFCVRVSQES